MERASPIPSPGLENKEPNIEGEKKGTQKRKISVLGCDVNDIPENYTVEQFLNSQCETIIERLMQHSAMLVSNLQETFQTEKQQLMSEYNAACESKKKPKLNKEEYSVSILIEEGPYTGKTYTLHPKVNQPCLIGRSTGKKFKLTGISLPKDGEISTTHGKIEISDGKIYYSDSGSTNGTLVINTKQELETNELFELKKDVKLQLGASVLTVTNCCT